MPPPTDLSTSLPCHVCGYDLRAADVDGVCPECGGSVAEAKKYAAVPVRPAWRDSDPRWRRRMLAGVWILALLPVVDVIKQLNLGSTIPVPDLMPYRGVQTLEDTFFYHAGTHHPIFFCVGAVLLLARERGRQKYKLDSSRLWGVLSCYIVALVHVVEMWSISALVLTGIAAVFQEMPLRYQPAVTGLLAKVGTTGVIYGPYADFGAMYLAIAASSITVLLGCIPLFNALRSCGSKRAAMLVLAPLAAFALWQLWQVGWYYLRAGMSPPDSLYDYQIYFVSAQLPGPIFGIPSTTNGIMPTPFFSMELLKWLSVAACAIWLTMARIRSWRYKRTPTAI